MSKFNPGFDISWETGPLGFNYGEGVFGPEVEERRLDDIRKSLRDPNADGPDIVYAIAMDVGKEVHKEILAEKMLLFGVMTYAKGRLGDELIRSQGHIHKISSHSNWAPAEIYEVWEGEAIIYMQETAKDNPGKCYAVYAKAGDVVIVPPNWAHATISANPNVALTFGAWCDREYGFEYEEVRAHKGLAWYPLLDGDDIKWEHNEHYEDTGLIKKEPSDYSYLGLQKGVPVYEQFAKNLDLFQFVSKPHLKKDEWENFIP